MTAHALRPVGFLLLMLGFGLRLDSSWQGLATGLILVGGLASGVGLAAGRAAFVLPDDTR